MSVLFSNCKILATVDNDFKVITNGFLGVNGTFIDYIGSEKPEKHYDRVKDMHNKLLMPGLVNSHTHSAMNFLRGVGSNLPLHEWLQKIWKIEDLMTDEILTTGMEMGILEMLACGTTSFTDMYMRPIITQKCIEESGIKANLTRVVIGGNKDTDYLSFQNRLDALEVYRSFNGAFDDRLHIDWCLHAEYTVADHIAERFAEEMNQIGGRYHIHLAETKTEYENCVKKRGISPVQWFEKIGCFNLPCIAAHCVWLSPQDMEILKSKKVTAVHCPSSNLKLGSGIAPVPQMLEKELSIALGTDGSASNNNVNMFEEMHIASLIHKGVSLNPTVMNPSEIIKMATINGALSQGRQDTGSLGVGKKADIIAIDFDKPHLIPDTDIMGLLVYSVQGSDVCMTMVDGRILYENGEFLTMDKDRIFRDYKKASEFLVK